MDRETETCGHRTDERRGWAWNSIWESDSSPESRLFPGMVTLSLSPDDSSCPPPTLAPPGRNVVLISHLPAPRQTVHTSLSPLAPWALSHPPGLIFPGGLGRGWAWAAALAGSLRVGGGKRHLRQALVQSLSKSLVGLV